MENTLKRVYQVYAEMGRMDITLKEIMSDIANNYLTVCTTREGKNVLWYLDNNTNICVEILTGKMLTETEIDDQLC